MPLLTLWAPGLPINSPFGPIAWPSVGVVKPAGASVADCWPITASTIANGSKPNTRLRARIGICLLDHDRAGHHGMNFAVIRILPGLAKREGEVLIGVEDRRRELFFGAHDVMRDIILIDPGNGRAGFHSERFRSEREIVDFDCGCASSVLSRQIGINHRKR